MRTFMLYGALALGGCTAPEMAFPSLADLPQPPAPKTTNAEREAILQDVRQTGAQNREAGRMVRAGEELSRKLPPA